MANNQNGVDEMLDMLYEMIDEAKSVPFSSDCRLDRNAALDLLDSIRNRFPVELSESVKIVQNRDRYIQEAQQEATRILEQAQAQAKRIVDENETVRQARAAAKEAIDTARAKATEIMTKANDDAAATTRAAEDRAESLKRAANEYCADALRRTEDAVAEAYGEIKQSHDHFRALLGASVTSTPRRAPAYDVDLEEDD
ncbi:MAG: hypothetical protein IJ751_06425 [Oscillospiraceae bacterium]|nr:hypothetical protein [Oscillospiraceae bacterium]